MRIGFDVSFTCFEKTGCPWYTDSLIRAMVRHHPEHDYVLYHHFGRNRAENAAQGTTFGSPKVLEPYRMLSPQDAAPIWEDRGDGVTLAGDPQIVQANFFECPRIIGVPIVYVVYDLTFWVCPEFLKGGVFIGCTQGLSDAVRNASAFIFISHNTHEEFERHFPGWLQRKNLPHRVIHLGAREGGGTQGGVENEKDYWLFVGTVEPRKNLMTLLRAHEIYWSRSAAPRKLLIAGGPGWHSEQVHQEIARRAARNEVSYRGYVSESELEALYENARAVVYPSYYEGFGLPILEAMQRGVPVICSRTTSHPEVGGDAVEYFNAWSPEELAEKMLDLENSEPKRQLMSDRSLERAKIFSWEKTASETLEFYQEVIERSPKR